MSSSINSFLENNLNKFVDHISTKLEPKIKDHAKTLGNTITNSDIVKNFNTTNSMAQNALLAGSGGGFIGGILGAITGMGVMPLAVLGGLAGMGIGAFLAKNKEKNTDTSPPPPTTAAEGGGNGAVDTPTTANGTGTGAAAAAVGAGVVATGGLLEVGKNLVNGASTVISTAAKSAGTTINSLASNLGTVIGDVANSASATINGATSNVGTAISDVATNAGSAISSAASGLSDNLITAWGKMRGLNQTSNTPDETPMFNKEEQVKKSKQSPKVRKLQEKKKQIHSHLQNNNNNNNEIISTASQQQQLNTPFIVKQLAVICACLSGNKVDPSLSILLNTSIFELSQVPHELLTGQNDQLSSEIMQKNQNNENKQVALFIPHKENNGLFNQCINNLLKSLPFSLYFSQKDTTQNIENRTYAGDFVDPNTPVNKNASLLTDMLPFPLEVITPDHLKTTPRTPNNTTEYN